MDAEYSLVRAPHFYSLNEDAIVLQHLVLSERSQTFHSPSYHNLALLFALTISDIS